MPLNLEYTDTFAGEANYCWVRRAHIADDGLSDRAIVRRAKAWAGLTGTPCKVTSLGDDIEIRPRGMATVLFVTWGENSIGDSV